MLPATTEARIHYTLRIAAAMCFFGHGAFGMITKPIWANYFHVFGIGHDLAYQLMPLLGSLDILFGIILLIYPLRIVPAWLVCWGIVTALLRPLSGEPPAEFLERAGNFGAPLTLLLLAGRPSGWRDWFARMKPFRIASEQTWDQVIWCLRIVIFLLLLGHGWLNLIDKKGLISQYGTMGFSHPGYIAQSVGVLELTLALLVLVRPHRHFLLVLLLWKMTSELFYPHYEFLEWIERGGSYGVILALWFALGRFPSVEAPPTLEFQQPVGQ
jgi:uncharacterized membrane protein YphA (DoxX/SURF4 family)